MQACGKVYELERTIDKSKVVYRAKLLRETGTLMYFNVKMVQYSPKVKDIAQSQMRVARTLKHAQKEHLIRVICAERVSESTGIIVTEAIENESLQEILEARNRMRGEDRHMSPEELHLLIREGVKGLRALEDTGLFILDLNPGNFKYSHSYEAIHLGNLIQYKTLDGFVPYDTHTKALFDFGKVLYEAAYGKKFILPPTAESVTLPRDSRVSEHMQQIISYCLQAHFGDGTLSGLESMVTTLLEH